MSAVPQPHFSVQSFPLSRPRRGSVSPKTNISKNPSLKQARQHPLSQDEVTEKLSSNHNFVAVKQPPVRLKRLFLIQKLAFGIGSCLMISSALIYASSVPIPQMWSQEYEQLKSLQRQERELTAANETIKNDLLKQAQKDAKEAQHELSYLRPDNVLFVEEADILPKSSTNKPKNSPFDSIPLSY